jgi:hypothetical protein
MICDAEAKSNKSETQTINFPVNIAFFGTGKQVHKEYTFGGRLEIWRIKNRGGKPGILFFLFYSLPGMSLIWTEWL